MVDLGHRARSFAGDSADAADAALVWQRAVSERLLLGAFDAQERATAAMETAEHATFLAVTGRDLAMSLDQAQTRAAVRRRSLPRFESWCLVDVIESTGALHRLAGWHPRQAKRELAELLEDPGTPQTIDALGTRMTEHGDPGVLTRDSGAALLAAMRGQRHLDTLDRIGWGTLLVVPMVVRATAIGFITFITREGDRPLSGSEITLAGQIADRCALALDNARLFHETERLRASSEAANKAKTDFINNMSHELLTPLNAIGGYAEIIEMGLRGPVSQQQQIDLARIRLNQQHLLTMIARLLDFGRDDGVRAEYALSAVSVHTALDEVIEMLHIAAAERGMEFRRDFDPTEPFVWADCNHLRQILVNLVMNAVKYASDLGSYISLRSIRTAGSVFISVTDDGPGIAPEELERIFERFVQLGSGFTKRQGGVGLGLSISRDLARAMQGELTVESSLGVGTTFTLSLRRAPG